MVWFKAEKTLNAINEMLERDQGASYRSWFQKVMPHIGDAYRGLDAPFRPHLGASQVGKECARAIWYSFHWTTRKKSQGRMVRLFHRGHCEEGRFIALLLAIGVTVFQQDENGKQFRISGAHGHYGGSGDGIGVNVPDLLPGQRCVLEFKTSSTKIFLKVQEFGVRQEKFEHWVQTQQYMFKMEIPVALYMMVCKETDEIHAEIVPFDREYAEKYFDRGEKIVFMPRPPEKLNQSPGFYKCKFCDDKETCHMGKAPDVNCRTCNYSKPTNSGGGEWVCLHKNIAIPLDLQYNACSDYVIGSAYK